MAISKIKLTKEQIDFLSEKIQKGFSLSDAIVEWNIVQEYRKGLTPGCVVKIVNEPKWSNYYGKKGFVAATLAEPGTGFDPEKSGKFSVYLLHGDESLHGDMIGRSLESTGDFIEREFLINYKEKHGTDDFIRKELDSLLDSL